MLNSLINKVDSFNKRPVQGHKIRSYLPYVTKSFEKQTNKTFWHAKARIMPYIYVTLLPFLNSDLFILENCIIPLPSETSFG